MGSFPAFLRDEDLPRLMGDWFLPVLQASFSGAREAQLIGPSRGPYPNFAFSAASARL